LQQKNTRSGLVFLIIAVKLNSETVIAVKMPLTVVRMVNLLAVIDFHLSWPVLQVTIASPVRGVAISMSTPTTANTPT